MKKPNFFIIGAPKCGTTSLASWLGKHPQVFMSSVKEPHYYSMDYQYGLGQQNKRDYLRLFEHASEIHVAVGEASTFYLYSRDAVSNILASMPDAKFVVCLRNPVDMVYSLHEQLIVGAEENELDFEAAWDLQVVRAMGRHIPKSTVALHKLQYAKICSLGEQMARLFRAVPRRNVHIILLEDMKADPREIWLDVLKFLNVSDDGCMEFPVYNSAKERRWMGVHKLIKKIHKIKCLLGIPRFRTGITAYLNSLNVRQRPRPPMSHVMRHKLQKYFAPDVHRLEDILGRDLSHWLRE